MRHSSIRFLDIFIQASTSDSIEAKEFRQKQHYPEVKSRGLKKVFISIYRFYHIIIGRILVEEIPKPP